MNISLKKYFGYRHCQCVCQIGGQFKHYIRVKKCDLRTFLIPVQVFTHFCTVVQVCTDFCMVECTDVIEP